MSFPMAIFVGLCGAAIVFCCNEAFVNPENRPQALEYAAKWFGILSPLWLFILFLLYAIIAGECTVDGYDPAYWPRYFSLG